MDSLLQNINTETLFCFVFVPYVVCFMEDPLSKIRGKSPF